MRTHYGVRKIPKDSTFGCIDRLEEKAHIEMMERTPFRAHLALNILRSHLPYMPGKTKLLTIAPPAFKFISLILLTVKLS